MTKKLSLRDLERRAGKIEAARTKSVKQQYKQIKRDVMDTCSLDELKGFATMYIPRKNHLFCLHTTTKDALFILAKQTTLTRLDGLGD